MPYDGGSAGTRPSDFTVQCHTAETGGSFGAGYRY